MSTSPSYKTKSEPGPHRNGPFQGEMSTESVDRVWQVAASEIIYLRDNTCTPKPSPSRTKPVFLVKRLQASQNSVEAVSLTSDGPWTQEPWNEVFDKRASLTSKKWAKVDDSDFDL